MIGTARDNIVPIWESVIYIIIWIGFMTGIVVLAKKQHPVMRAIIPAEIPSQYEIHRSEWIKTGDISELIRMLEYVK